MKTKILITTFLFSSIFFFPPTHSSASRFTEGAFFDSHIASTDHAIFNINEKERLVDELETAYDILPTEEPSIFVLDNVNKNKLFKNDDFPYIGKIQNGDYVFDFGKTELVFVYRESDNSIVNIGTNHYIPNDYAMEIKRTEFYKIPVWEKELYEYDFHNYNEDCPVGSLRCM